MKTTIKIHDTQWFKEHCKVCNRTSEFDLLIPKYDSWGYVRTIYWLHGEDAMSHLEGKVLEAEHDCGNEDVDMNDVRYMAKGYWIPNWAIEWVKEEAE